WVNNLNAGMSPGDVAFGFAASKERETQRVTADYQQFLGRAPQGSEAAYWVNRFLAGADNEAVIAGFVGSQEFFQAQGKGDNNVHDWLFTACNQILHRSPTAGESINWLNDWETKLE